MPTEVEESEEMKPPLKIINVDYQTDSDYDFNHQALVTRENPWVTDVTSSI